MRYLRLITGIALALACGSLVLLSSGDTHAQWIPGTPQFQPTFNFKLCNDLDPDFYGPADLQGGGGMCPPNTTPGGHPDTTLSFAVPYGHMNYAQSYFVTTGGGDTDGDTVINPATEETRLDGSQIGGPNPDGTGAAAGGLDGLTTLGLAANPCNSTIYPNFIWWEAEYDITDTVACQPEGTADRWSNLATDGGDPWAGHADKDSPAVTQFPDCTVRLFDPDGDGIDTDGNPTTIGDQPVQPRARFAGLTQVPPGGDWQMLQVVEFEPGDLQEAFAANPGTTQHPYAKLGSELGYNQVTVLNDPKAVILQPSIVSDFCSTLSTRGMLKGRIDTDGDTSPDIDRVTMPTTPGSHMVQARTQSLRDADGDGLENNFDTCPWTPNIDDPYTFSGTDRDMMDPACDENPAGPIDEDGDGYLNPQDWCPKVYNPLPAGETDSENTQLYNAAVPLPNAVVKDGGPQADQIGDDCDNAVRTWKGEFKNNTDSTVNDLHLTYLENPGPNPIDRTIFKVISVSGGTSPDTWDWEIDGHGVNTVAADCASDPGDNVVDITGTNGTTVEDGHTLTVVVQPCKSEKITTLFVMGQWTLDGTPVGAFLVVNVPKYTASPTVSDGLFFNVIHVDSVCIEGGTVVDADGDGWCNYKDTADTDTYISSNIEDPGPNQGPCDDGDDNGWDGLTDRYDDDCNPNAGIINNSIPGQMKATLMDSVAGDPDDDGDGYDSLPEWYLGVDPGNDCPLFVGEHDAWPCDFDMNTFVNLADVFNVLPPYFGSSPGNPDTNGDGIDDWSPRRDLVPDGFINLGDVFMVLPPYFGSNCT